MDKCLIIMPCYNEEASLEKVVRRVKAAVTDASFLIINDGSTDKTATIAKGLAVNVIDLPFNLGYGSALQTGYKYALRYNYDFIVQMDADGQHEASCVQELIKELKKTKADIVLGSRFKDGGEYKPSFAKSIGIKLFSAIVSFVLKQKITDPTSGFQALDKKAIQFYCRDVFPSDFPDADILILSHFAGLTIREIPVLMHKSPQGKRPMHNGIISVYYIFKMLLSITVALLRKKPEKEANDAL